jgi:DNA-binding response OmpR family regulator
MPYSVLVVEDEPHIIESLSFLMKRAGHKVRIARDGDAAIRTMEAEKPDLVILDITLPRRDGLDVCRTIRAEERWRDVRVIMLTARGRELDRRKGLETGADDYILKPFSTSDIVQRVEALLESGRAPEHPGEEP